MRSDAVLPVVVIYEVVAVLSEQAICKEDVVLVT